MQYKLFFLESDSSKENYIMTSELTVEVSELNKFTEYCFWVIAINENGLGSASDEVIVRTLSDVPSDPPQNVTVEAGSSTVSAFFIFLFILKKSIFFNYASNFRE